MQKTGLELTAKLRNKLQHLVGFASENCTDRQMRDFWDIIKSEVVPVVEDLENIFVKKTKI